MLNEIFSGLFDTSGSTVIALNDLLLCVGTALICGLLLAFSYSYQTRSSHSFVATLALLPAVVCLVIMMVNGNLGAGVAVAGAFSLVRFRSAPGSASEIGAIFLAMACGLLAGMGYLAYALLCAVLLGGIMMLYSRMDFGISKRRACYRTLHVTIPEDLDYTGVFDDILRQYASEYELTGVKTTDMGSLYRLTYNLTLKQPGQEKEMIDKLRVRNGNLEISVSHQPTDLVDL
jgi:uncharacterized membrane protein YhiD involved in acid resistance